MQTATLIIPGLSEVNATSCERVLKMAARSVRHQTSMSGYELATLRALGYDDTSIQVPAAKCSHLADFNESASEYCARADPVCLKTDREDARLIPAENLSLEPSQAERLVGSLNEHFDEDGLRFLIGRKNRWYVTGSVDTELDAAPVNQVAGRPVANYLPQSANASKWRRLANEVQMLLHNHPVNVEREAGGLLPVNALWFWGAAPLPERSHSPSCRLFSDAAYAVGLARLSGITAFPYAEGAASLRQKHGRGQAAGSRSDNVIIVNTALLESILSQDEARQQEQLLSIENSLLASAERALWRGQLKRLVLDTCDQYQYVVTRASLCKVWRRPTSLSRLEDRPTVDEFGHR
ncbi:MAG: hypothetical protein KTR32_42085 [Granulosicoccus sp.]|nr:hypothetical protein [Granulosicoccus sp.]